MILVTIEIAPGGAETLRRTIATMRISNLSDLADVSDYRIVAMQAANSLTGEPAGIAQFQVLAHRRQQPLWALIQRACEEASMTDWVEL
jgi:hypothetical protein